jgi:hypothetical protein
MIFGHNYAKLWFTDTTWKAITTRMITERNHQFSCLLTAILLLLVAKYERG